MVIEHLNNNGFDCKISNLYFLLDVKNKYKGNYLDKFIKESIPVASLNIFHIMANKTFQITIAFNAFFTNEKGEFIEVMKLKYNCDYCTVLQDAEKILEDIVYNRKFSMSELKKHYRFSDHRIRYSENLNLTDEEKTLPSGSVVQRDGKVYFVKRNDDYGTMYFLSATYDENWD